MITIGDNWCYDISIQDERDLDVTSPGILTTTRSQQENEGKKRLKKICSVEFYT